MDIEYTSNADGFFDVLMMDIAGAMHIQNDAAMKAAKGYAPKDTGKLAGSIDGEVKVTSEEVTSTIYSPLPYAQAQELGTAKSPGKHFLKKGVLSSVKVLEKEFK